MLHAPDPGCQWKVLNGYILEAQLLQLLRRPGTRLVVIGGPGGSRTYSGGELADPGICDTLYRHCLVAELSCDGFGWGRCRGGESHRHGPYSEPRQGEPWN